MTKIMTKKYRSPDQAKLKIVCDEVCDNIESLLEHFGIDYRNNSKMISMSCPIHGGDNESALNIYPEGERYRGNWKCRTHNCEQEFKASVIGFIRGIISRQKYDWKKPGDRTCPFNEALEYALAFIDKDLKQIKISKSDKDKQSFTNVVNYLSNQPESVESKVTRKHIIQSINIPSEYYLNRNYLPETLIKYDVGLCSNPSKPMFNRVVVPIYDNDYQYMVGCTCRSIFEKCNQCSCYHNPQDSCPPDDKKWFHPKWKHSAEFKSQNYLYNFWFAKKAILDTHTAIIVESPGNVWRLEENGIHNSVATFGSFLSDRQKILLDSSGAMNLIILTDNDDAGNKAADQILTKCKNTYRIFRPSISRNDVADMTSEEIDSQIKKYIQDII